MTWILTKSGVEFDLTNPTPEMVDLSDIAHSLSNIKRFNGHTDVNCSVALHSVIMSYAVPEQYAKHALLHDAHEAYIGDISSPLKLLLGSQLNWLEHNIDAAISKRLGVVLGPSTVVRWFDLRHLRYEKENYLELFGKPWPCLAGIPSIKVDFELEAFYGVNDSREHEQLFLKRCRELGVQRDRR